MRITKENLTRYDQHFKSWQRRRLGYGNALENWHQTEEAGAVAFYPVGGSPLEGKVKFSFKETPPASGDKSPTNPSTISGVSEVKVTRAGKNIVTPFPVGTKTTNGVTFVAGDDGTIVANGTATDAAFFSWGGGQTKLPAGTVLTLSGCPSGGSTDTYCLRWGDGTYDVGSGNTFTVGSGSQYFTIRIRPGTTVSNLVFKPQLELGTTATTFEPYDGADYTVNLNNTYYGGEIDLATGVMTVTHYTVTISAINNISDNLSNGKIIAFLPTGRAVKLDNTQICCNRFPASTDDTIERIQCRGSDGFWSVSLYIDPTRLGLSSASMPNRASTAEDKTAVNAWLANNPIDLVFKATQPTTIQLDPLALTALAQTSRHEPRLNTVYTDADSIQITYQKSPIRAATEQEMAILGLGGNV